MSRHRRPSLGAGFGYTPGEQPPDGQGWVKLNTNESPLPPAAGVAGAVAAAAALLHRYPSPDGEPLRTGLARHHGVDPSQVVVGNGADALLAMCFRAWCEPGSTVATTTPTYSLLATLATMHGVVERSSRLSGDGSLTGDMTRVEAQVRFIVNPNSPTGTWVEPGRLEEAVGGARGVTVIDEAYCDFAPASCIPLLGAHPDWLVVRTFSKSYALAGLRVGYAVGATELVADLAAVADSYALDRCAVAGAGAALADTAHHDALIDLVVGERARLSATLASRGWQVVPSQANFICATPPDEPAAAVADRLRERRILVRQFADGGDGALLRITVGTRAENDTLLDALA